MTAIDWWLWIRSWISGTVRTSSESILLYRQHPRQQQHWYGRSHFALDGSRMLMSILDRQDFHDSVRAFSDEERGIFVRQVIEDPRGFNIGNGFWSPLLQIRLADVLGSALTHDQVQSLYSQGSIGLGVVPNLSTLRALNRGESAARIPRDTWRRVSLHVFINGLTCRHIADWLDFLGLSDQTKPGDATLTFSCSCAQTKDAGDPSLSIQMRCPLFSETDFSLEVPTQPSDADSSELRFMLGETLKALSGNPHMPRVLRKVEVLRLRWGNHPAFRKILRLYRK